MAELVLAPNLKSSWKPVSPDAPVRPLEPASETEEPHFSPSSRVNAKGLPADQFEQILQQRDAQLANLLEDWMGRITLLLQSSLDGERRSSRIHKPPVIPGTSPGPVQDGPSVESANSGNSNATANENQTNPRRKSATKVTVRVRTAELKADGEGNEEEEEGGSGSMTSLAFLREKGVLCIGGFDKQPEESWLRFFRRKVELLVTSWFFEAFFATIIVTNSIFIALQVEVASMDPGAEMDPGFFVFASVYTFFFTFELILRIFAKGIKIFCGDDWGWMLLDGMIVATSLFEFIIEVVVSNDESDQANVLTNMRLLRILRIAKITRAFRIVRLVRFIRSLRTLLLCIGRTLRAMAWSAVLLALIIFLFGLIFTDICTEYLAQDTVDVELATFLELRSGSLVDSMHTLYASITGGFTWIEARDAFARISPIWGLLFETYIAFCNFAVLNVMTGVFCQSAIESAEKDHELNLESVSQEKEKYFRAVRRLFTQLDQNSDGGITRKEFERAWSDPVLQTVFDALEISSTDAWDLFRQLDRDGSGEVDVDEFLEGCMMIKGPARSIDVVCIKKDLMALRHKLGMH